MPKLPSNIKKIGMTNERLPALQDFDYYHNPQGGGAPVLALTGNGVSIANGDATPSVGDDTDFGETAKAVTVTRTFTITNSGNADVNGLSVSAPAGYTVTVQPSATLAPAAQTTFSVRFDATAYQTYAGNVTISSDELADFTFAITAVATYSATVLATSPLRYNKLNEGSGSAIVDSSGNGYTGSYTGVTWDGTQSPFGEPVPFWDGANDYGNLYSAAFASAFNMDEGFALIWFKASNAGIWADGTNDKFLTIRRDVDNRIEFGKHSNNNSLIFLREGNNVQDFVLATVSPTTAWFSVGLSWSVANDQLIAYVNGAQVGTTQTGLVASAGSGLNSVNTLIGAVITTPAEVASGYLSQCIIWNAPVDVNKLALMTV